MKFKTTTAAVALTALTGCASIVSGSNQPVSVETVSNTGQQVAGASCKLVNDKGTWFVNTPGSTTVQRSYEPLSVQCEKASFVHAITNVGSTTKGMTFGNILIGGIIGAGVDMSTGAAYDYPTLIRVRMVADGAEASPAKPASVAEKSAAPPTAPAKAKFRPAACDWATPGASPGVCD